MDEDLKRKLSRLGVTKGLKPLTPTPPPVPEVPKPLASQPMGTTTVPAKRRKRLPGGIVQTPLGPVWVDSRAYPAAQIHGRYALSDGASIGSDVLRLLGVPELGDSIAFIDTETTGLAGGAGTLAFLIGVGVWDSPPSASKAVGPFRVHLIFMRDPDEEPAALHYLQKLLEPVTGLVTFNGRGFDLPILQSRFVLSRMVPRFLELPHLDLLTVARLLWREHLPSRRLGALEEDVLEFHRTEEDIASAFIPFMYREYLETGKTEDMIRVLYHNAVDVLSMVSLLAHVARLLEHPESCHPAAAEWVGIGRIYERAGRGADALEIWHRVLSGAAGELDEGLASRLWADLGARSRQRGGRDEAAAVWRQWADACPLAVQPCVELAKYAEWAMCDMGMALAYTDTAIARAVVLPDQAERAAALPALRHRRERLARKIGRGGGAPDRAENP